ncbi:hypothetical protein JCM17960_10770 [Magnetospira thiophila]
MRLLITRPEEDAAPLAAELQARGHEVQVEPLLTIVPLGGPPLDLQRVQALLMTSANGVRAFARTDERRHLPVLAVGDATARAAREAGFENVRSAGGDVTTLAALVRSALKPADGALLHVAGSHVAGDLSALLAAGGFAYRRVVLYSTRRAQSLSEAARNALREGHLDGVVFFSPRTAATFASLASTAGVDEALTAMTAFCLSAAVAEQARALTWKDVRMAAHPDQASLIACIETQQAERDR